MKANINNFALKLINPFGISRGVSTESHIVFLEFEGGGVGECAPVRYKNQDPYEAPPFLEKMAEGVTDDNLFDLDYHLKRAKEIAGSFSSAICAFDIALHDRIGRKLNLPLYKVMGFSKPENARSSFTIGLDTDEIMVEKTHEAVDYPHLKIKLGRDDADKDMTTLKKIREAAGDKIIRVDANTGWSYDTAKECIKRCADLDIEFVEAPLAIGNYDELEKLHKESPLPIIADEDVQGLESLIPLVGKVDGINIKLSKSNGLWEARQMVGFARAQGWQLMLGCMIESSIGIAAAAHLAGAAVSLDLDSEQLISNNPCGPESILQKDGFLKVSDRSGLGVDLNLPK